MTKFSPSLTKREVIRTILDFHPLVSLMIVLGPELMCTSVLCNLFSDTENFGPEPLSSTTNVLIVLSCTVYICFVTM